MKVTSKIDLGSLLHFRASFPENDLAEQYAGRGMAAQCPTLPTRLKQSGQNCSV